MTQAEQTQKHLYKKYNKVTLRVKEVARELGVCDITIYRMLKNGKIKYTSNAKRGIKSIAISEVAALICAE